jgi:hypothetical protein
MEPNETSINDKDNKKEEEIFKRPDYIDIKPEFQKFEEISILGLGGAGNRTLCKQFKTKDLAIGIRSCYGFDTSDEIMHNCDYNEIDNQLYRFNLFRSRHGKPAARVFPLTEYIVDESVQRQDSESKILREALDRSGVSETILFVIFGAAGGVGHGIFRSATKNFEANFYKNIVPLLLLPEDGSDPAELMNSCAAYDYIDNIEKLNLLILIDNNALSGSYKNLRISLFPHLNSSKINIINKANIADPNRGANKNLAQILKIIAMASHMAIAEGTKIHLSGAITLLSRKSKFSTFGYGSSIFFGGEVRSTLKALNSAIKNSLLKRKNNDLSEYKFIAFTLVPYSANSSAVRDVIKEFFQNEGCNVECFIASVQSYTIDLVLWMAGEFQLSFKDDIINRNLSQGVDGHIKRLEEKMLLELVSPDSKKIERLLDIAKQNMEYGIKKVSSL